MVFRLWRKKIRGLCRPTLSFAITKFSACKVRPIIKNCQPLNSFIPPSFGFIGS